RRSAGAAALRGPRRPSHPRRPTRPTARAHRPCCRESRRASRRPHMRPASWWCRDRFRRRSCACQRLRTQFPLNPCKQITDVIPLEYSIPKRGQNRAAAVVTALGRGVPSRRERRELIFVLGALRVDRLPRLIKARTPHFWGCAGGSHVANLVEL